MSWSVEIHNASRAEIPARLEALTVSHHITDPQEVRAATDAQLAAAKVAVQQMVDALPYAFFTISIAGHANPQDISPRNFNARWPSVQLSFVEARGA